MCDIRQRNKNRYKCERQSAKKGKPRVESEEKMIRRWQKERIKYENRI